MLSTLLHEQTRHSAPASTTAAVVDDLQVVDVAVDKSIQDEEDRALDDLVDSLADNLSTEFKDKLMSSQVPLHDEPEYEAEVAAIMSEIANDTSFLAESNGPTKQEYLKQMTNSDWLSFLQDMPSGDIYCNRIREVSHIQ
jgi:hypothetical protein